MIFEKNKYMINTANETFAGFIELVDEEVKHLVIPSHVNGVPVTWIHNMAFMGGKNLESVIIPNTVTQIGSSAFAGCTNLQSVHLPPTIEIIGVGAFKDCTSLASIALPTSILDVKRDVFKGCTSLKEIHFPDNILEIGDNAFEGCSSLTHVITNPSMQEVGNRAFAYCTNLKKFELTNCETDMWDKIFEGVDGVEFVCLNDPHLGYCLIDNEEDEEGE